MDTVIEVRLNAAMKALATGNPRDALEALEPALEAARARALPEEEMLAAGLLAPALAQLGRLAEASAQAARARALAHERGDEDAVARYAELETRIASALAVRERAERPLSDAEIEAALDHAGDAMTRGDPARACLILEALAEAMAARGLSAPEASARGMLAQALVMAGREADAEAHARRALALAEELRDPQAAAHFRELLDSLGAREAGRTVHRSQVAEQVAPALDDAREALQDERFDDAIAALEPAVEAARTGDAPSVEATARGLLAQALLLAGRRAEAVAHVERALDLARRQGEEEAVESFTQLLLVATGLKPEVGEA